MIEVLSTINLNTVQDIGRRGYRRFGVGSSGVMDAVALQVGNILLDNEEDAAAIEVQMFPFIVRFTSAHGFALTGADCQAKLDGRALPPWWADHAGAGQVLRMETPTAGARTYLTVRGGIDVPIVLGSRSTHLRGGFGGHYGRALKDGDLLAVGVAPMARARAFGVTHLLQEMSDDVEVRALPAADYEDFPSNTQDAFWLSTWRISAQSNRHGYRLSGPTLGGADRFDLRSSPIMPGIVQIPPSGSPIIQMSDANSAGGYPKMATVIDADLALLGQARLGARIRFRLVDSAMAAAAHRAQAAYLANLRRMAALWSRTGTVKRKAH